MRHRACVRDSRRLQHSMLLASLLISSATAFLHVPKAPLDIKFRPRLTMRSAEEFGTQNSLLSVAVPKLSGASQLHQRRPVARSEQGWTVLFASSSDDTPQNRTQAAEAAELPAEQQKGKKRTPTSQKIGRVKMLLQAAVVSLYLGSTLILDFSFQAIRPQNFLFVVGMGVYCFALNAWHARGLPPRSEEEQAAEEGKEEELPAFCSASLFNVRGPGRWEGFAMFAFSVPAAWAFGLSNPLQKLPMVGPHLYLIMMQILLEALGRARRWAPPVRVFIPVAFNTYRLLSLAQFFLAAAYEAPLGCRISSSEKLFAFLSLLLWAANLALCIIPSLLFPPPPRPPRPLNPAP